MSDQVPQLARDLVENTLRLSSAAEAYFVALDHDLALHTLTIDVALRSDYMAFVARRALDGKGLPDSDPVKLAQTDPGPITTELRKHSQQFMEMFLARTVDNFQCYIVDLVRAVLRKRPEILTNSQPSISVETLLSFSSKEEIVHYIIERKVNSLAYQGFKELQDWCTERGIPIVLPAGEQRHDLPEIVATRNIIVHNRGLVDEKYLNVSANLSFKLGECRCLEPDDFFAVSHLMSECVLQTDVAAVRKFDLPVVSWNGRRVLHMLGAQCEECKKRRKRIEANIAPSSED